MMDTSRYLLLAALGITAYFLVHLWNQDYNQPVLDQQDSLTETRPGEPATDTTAPPALATSPAPGLEVPEPASLPVHPEGDQAGTVPQVVQADASDFIDIETDVLQLRVALRGGDLVLAQLPEYPASLEAGNRPYIMLDPRNQYAAQSGLVGPDGPDADGERPLYQAAQRRYTLGARDSMEVPLTYRDETGLRVTKLYRFSAGSYLVALEFRVENRRTEPVQVNLYAQLKRDSRPSEVIDKGVVGMNPYLGAATSAGSRRYEKVKFKEVAESAYSATADQGYMALVQHYFLTAWIPEGPGPYTFTGRKLPNRDIYLFGFTGPGLVVPPGGEGGIGARFYAGPKDQYVLRDLADGLDLTVDYGFLWWLAQPLFHALTFMHGLVGNWGLAIVLLTILVKLVLYPLSAASYRSMAKMRSLQPEMERLRERHGGDRQKLSQAVMELYSREGANPLGGCLPLLLQMPVFIALYWVLLESVELRQAPLDGYWIRDLSVKDPWFVLPILMGVSMYVTQLMQPEPPDPMQARVFKIMPVMFTFFFLWFPSGLVLYWLCNNVLSVLQQWWVNRRLKLQESRAGK